MSNLDDFVINTDYATLKNDGKSAGSVTIPAGQTVPAASRSSFTSTVNTGMPISFFLTSMNPSQEPGAWYLWADATLDRITPPPVGSNSFLVLTYVSISGSTINFKVDVYNPFILPLPLGSYTETFTFNVKTYKAPF